jgi:aspartate/methionine/tyrosine aminotransferase
MISIPQYPLYSATIPCQGGTSIPYYLDESRGWGLDVRELRRSVAEAKSKGVEPRGIVVINPGNPTGSCLSIDNIAEIIDFASHEGLAILADEVYQLNIYNENKPFVSFKKVLHYMGEAYKDVELLSFHSTSKGVIGECGKRGGYVEMTNVLPEVHQQYLKLATLNLCPNLIGQLTVGLMVNPPKPSDPSYPLYREEYDRVYSSLKRRSELVTKTLNKMEGISCVPSEGAMYAFPRITLPPKAVEEAKKLGKPADTLYCLELLSATGLCVVPGSGFGQVDGTWHFRTTILPQEEELTQVLGTFEKFHRQYMEKYE